MSETNAVFGKVEITVESKYKSYYCAVVNKYSTDNKKVCKNENELINDIVKGGYLDKLMKKCGLPLKPVDDGYDDDSDSDDDDYGIIKYVKKSIRQVYRNQEHQFYDIKSFDVKFNILRLIVPQ